MGWCAAAPRASYPTALRSPLYRERDAGEDRSVWFVSCFYVHRSARHQGITRALLQGVVDVAAASGAVAVEGLPRADGDRVGALDAYLRPSKWAASGPLGQPAGRRNSVWLPRAIPAA